MDDDENGQATKKQATIVPLILFKFLNIVLKFHKQPGPKFFYLMKTTLKILEYFLIVGHN